MADVRGATGAPGVGAFTGYQTPTPSTPLYVDLSVGDLWVLISETPTLVGGVPGSSSFVIGQQVFDKHFTPLPNPADSTNLLAERVFNHMPLPIDAAVLGNASDILQQRVFRPGQLPATWS